MFIFVGFLYLFFGLYVCDDYWVVLANSFVFFYGFYYFLGKKISFLSDVVLSNIFLLSFFFGSVYFIFSYYSFYGYIPYKVHASSDVLPIVSGILICYLVLFQHRGFWFYFIFASLVIFMVFITGGRGVLLSSLIVLFLFLLKNNKFNYFFIFIFLFVVFFISYLNIDYFVDASSVDGSMFNISYRLLAWKEILVQSVSDNYLFQFGYKFDAKNILDLFPSYFFLDGHDVYEINPHNSFLVVLYRSGLIGLIFLLLIIRFIIKSKLYDFSKLVVLFLVFTSLTTPVLELHFLAPLFWIFTGIHSSKISAMRVT